MNIYNGLYSLYEDKAVEMLKNEDIITFTDKQIRSYFIKHCIYDLILKV